MNLVTGATGLLGTHVLLELLSRGESVRALYREGSDRSTVKQVFDFYRSGGLYERIEWVTGDVLDVMALQDAMQDCRTVWHCAAIVSYHPADRKHMYKVNVEGTANVVNAALACGVGQLCHVSSIAALGRTKDGETLDESSEWQGDALATHYGITKHLSELEIWRGTQEGLSAVVVNPGFIIGPGSFHRSSPGLFLKADQGIPFYPPGGTGFVAATDVARCMVELVQRAQFGKRFVVVAESLSMQEVVSRVCEALGKPAPQRPVTRLLVWLALWKETLGEWITRKKAMVTREMVRNLSWRFYYSADAVRAATGLSFTPVQEAITETARFFRSTPESQQAEQ